MQKLIISYLLLIVALILLFFIGLTSTILLFFVSLVTGKGADYMYRLAYSIDQFGNVFISPIANHLLRKNGGYEFGDPDRTISYALGMNKKTATLSLLGKTLCRILNIFDKNHCEKSIQNN